MSAPLYLSCSPCDRPRVIESLRGIEVVDVAAGGAHSACVTSAGDLYTWGKGRYGRLGHSDSEDQLKPKLVSGGLGSGFVLRGWPPRPPNSSAQGIERY